MPKKRESYKPDPVHGWWIKNPKTGDSIGASKKSVALLAILLPVAMAYLRKPVGRVFVAALPVRPPASPWAHEEERRVSVAIYMCHLADYNLGYLGGDGGALIPTNKLDELSRACLAQFYSASPDETLALLCKLRRKLKDSSGLVAAINLWAAEPTHGEDSYGKLMEFEKLSAIEQELAVSKFVGVSIGTARKARQLLRDLVRLNGGIAISTGKQ